MDAISYFAAISRLFLMDSMIVSPKLLNLFVVNLFRSQQSRNHKEVISLFIQKIIFNVGPVMSDSK